MSSVQHLKRLALGMLPASRVPPLAARVALLLDEVELHLLKVLCRSDATSVDIGANLGIYTEILRRYSKDVVAVEPHPALARRLRRAFTNEVRVVDVALSAAQGRASIRVPVVGGREIDTRGSLEPTANGGLRTVKTEVRVLTLDLLQLGTVGFIKIDVEGHEHDVVSGGLNLLRACRPRMLIELEERHRAGSIEQMVQQLASIGYEGFFVSGQQLSSIERFDAQRQQASGHAKAVGGGRAREYVNNFIFLAQEECASLVPRLQQRLEHVRGWMKVCHALEF